MRPQQDFSRSFYSCCCPPLLSCSFLVSLGLHSHYPSTFLVVFFCFLFLPLVRTALLLEVCFRPCYVPEPRQPGFSDCVYLSDFVYQCNLLSQHLSGNLVSYSVSSGPSQYSPQS